MLVCKKCGADNPLGRVFCGGCGGKLDLSDMTRDSVADTIRPNFFVAHWRVMVIAVLVLIAILVGLALWPKTTLLGEKGNTIGSGRAMRQLGVIAGLAPGRKVAVEIAEKDLNGYLEYRKIRRTPVEMCSVQLFPQTMRARLVKKLGSWPLGPIRLEPRISYDVRCNTLGGQLIVVSASIGHLPAVGPLKRVAVKPYQQLFAKGNEGAVLKNASDIAMDEGKVKITGGR